MGDDAYDGDPGATPGSAPDATGDGSSDDEGFHGSTDGGVYVGQMDDGTIVTSGSWQGEQVHEWHRDDVQGFNGRGVHDQHGNTVIWDPDTGEVITALHDENAGKGVSLYEVDRDFGTFDE
jgi:hypothetical protein